MHKLAPLFSLPRCSILICFFLVVTQIGCVMIPIPTSENKVMDGEQVTEEQLAFLVPDVTTKEEVIRNLGNPNVIWEDARVFAYDWVVRQGILVWAVGGGYQGYAGIEDIPKRYSFLIQFDEHDRVQSFEKVVRPSLQSYGDFLTEWVRNRDKAAPSNSNDESE